MPPDSKNRAFLPIRSTVRQATGPRVGPCVDLVALGHRHARQAGHRPTGRHASTSRPRAGGALDLVARQHQAHQHAAHGHAVATVRACGLGCVITGGRCIRSSCWPAGAVFDLVNSALFEGFDVNPVFQKTGLFFQNSFGGLFKKSGDSGDKSKNSM